MSNLSEWFSFICVRIVITRRDMRELSTYYSRGRWFVCDFQRSVMSAKTPRTRYCTRWRLYVLQKSKTYKGTSRDYFHFLLDVYARRERASLSRVKSKDNPSLLQNCGLFCVVRIYAKFSNRIM